MTKYTRANAEALLSVVTAQPNCHWLPIPTEPDRESPSPIYINDGGIFINPTAEGELRWKPCHELPDGPDAPDRVEQPGLPFPFTANELAAWMLNGVGALVASAFGNLTERKPVEHEETDGPTVLGPDFSVLLDPDANKARQAIQAAFDLYRMALEQVGREPEMPPVSAPRRRAELRAEALSRHGLATPEGAVIQGIGYRRAAEKLRLVRSEVREAYQSDMVNRAFRGPHVEHAGWLAGMVQQLLAPKISSNEEQQDTPFNEGGDGAPDGVSSGEQKWLDKVREMAVAIIERDRMNDLFPSQVNIADEIARKLRDQNFVGPGGKPLSGSYIKRHGLNGISSAIHKSRSTRIKRGK